MLTRYSEIEKLYYSIGEVADMFGVNPSLIRFWEKEFPQLHPKKNSRGNRVYSKKDIELFQNIHSLVKEKGYTLEGAKNALRGNTLNDEKEVLVNKLIRIREELVSIGSGL